MPTLRERQDQVDVYLAVFYPNAPAASRHAMSKRFVDLRFRGRLPEIAGILASNHIRHVFTCYEKLLNRPLQPNETKEDRRSKARREVAEEHNRIIKKWRRGAPVRHSDLRAIQRKYKAAAREIRKLDATERMFHLPLLVEQENCEVAEFARRWMLGHYATVDEVVASSSSHVGGV